MKGLVLALLIGAVVSILSKIKKNPESNSTGGKTIFDDWTKMFSAEDTKEEVKTEPVRNDYETNNYKEDRTDFKDKIIRNNPITEDNKEYNFDLRKAIIYSSILDRPYK